MDDTLFFTAARNNGSNQRKVTLKGVTLMAGRAPAKLKRIKMKLLLPLSGENTFGMPGWLTDAFTFVSRSHDTVTPDIELRGWDVEFDGDNLFGDKAVQAPRSDLNGFSIREFGGGEDGPAVGLQCTVYAPFSEALCRWCGQMMGEEFYAKFTESTRNDEEDEPRLDLDGSAAENEDEEEEDDV